MLKAQLVQDFLRQEGLQALQDRYRIKVNRHQLHPNLVQFKYNQINSPMGEPIVQLCRGLILDEAADWGVVAHGFNKFFTHAGGHAATIDWTTAKVQAKEDGSLIQLFWYGDQWNVSTSGMPDARGQVGTSGKSFKELFWETWSELGYKLPGPLLRNCTLMFELCTKYNRVVVQHTRPRIVLIGIRDLISGREMPIEMYNPSLGYEQAQTFPLGSLEEVLAWADTLRGIESEGAVVCDRSFNRVKVKGKDYMAVTGLIQGMNERSILRMVLGGKEDDVIGLFPEWKGEFAMVKGRLQELLAKCEATWAETRHIEDRKEFALKVKDLPYSSAMFMMRGGKVGSFLEWAGQISIDNLMLILDLKLTPDLHQ